MAKKTTRSKAAKGKKKAGGSNEQYNKTIEGLEKAVKALYKGDPQRAKEGLERLVANYPEEKGPARAGRLLPQDLRASTRASAPSEDGRGNGQFWRHVSQRRRCRTSHQTFVEGHRARAQELSCSILPSSGTRAVWRRSGKRQISPTSHQQRPDLAIPRERRRGLQQRSPRGRGGGATRRRIEAPAS